MVMVAVPEIIVDSCKTQANILLESPGTKNCVFVIRISNSTHLAEAIWHSHIYLAQHLLQFINWKW